MTMKKFHRNLILTALTIGFISPSYAETAVDDSLGQFLEQNFSNPTNPLNVPTTAVPTTNSDDPIANFANRPAPATNGNLTQISNGVNATSGNIMPVTGQFQQQNAQYDFINRASNQNVAPISNTTTTTPNFAASSFAYTPLLNARSALVMNANTGKILYQKNVDTVRSIASISKLMSAMVLLDAKLNMYEDITITEDEIDRLKGTGSRLSIGTTLTRGELLHLGLMSSENRAIHALAHLWQP